MTDQTTPCGAQMSQWTCHLSAGHAGVHRGAYGGVDMHWPVDPSPCGASGPYGGSCTRTLGHPGAHRETVDRQIVEWPEWAPDALLDALETVRVHAYSRMEASTADDARCAADDVRVWCVREQVRLLRERDQRARDIALGAAVAEAVYITDGVEGDDEHAVLGARVRQLVAESDGGAA